MKKNQITNLLKKYLLAGLSLSILSCEKKEDLKPAPINNVVGKNFGEVYIDGFSSGLGYAAFANSYLKGFNVDAEVKRSGTSSMRFDVPNEGDYEGSFVGGIYIDSVGRDLSGYDALTFWAKGSQSAKINEIGFGNDFDLNKYVVTVPNIQLATYWKKYTIPLPDASKLTREKGLFWYSEGPEDKKGYTFWIDDVQYEKLGNIKLLGGSIFEGKELVQSSFVNSKIAITGMTQSSSLVNGQILTLSLAPSYFTFLSSDPGVATVSETGVISLVGLGTAKITATLGGKEVSGSMTVSTSTYDPAPAPTLNASDVISLYSNKYENSKVDYFNGYWQPYQTTQSLDIQVNGDNVISYTNFNFVGIEFKNPTVDVRQMTHLHFDLYTTDPIVAETALYVDLVNLGNPTNTRGKFKFDSQFLVSKKWLSCEVPVTIISQRDKVFQIIFDAPAQLMKNMYIDNIYFHK